MRSDADDLDFLVDPWIQTMNVQAYRVIASGLSPTNSLSNFLAKI